MKLFTSQFDFSPESRLITIRYAGDFALGPMEGAIGNLQRHPDFDPGYRRLYDLRSLHGIPPMTDGVEPLMRLMIQSDPPRARRAVVATGDVADKARIFAKLAAPSMIRIFDTIEAAEAWVLEPATE